MTAMSILAIVALGFATSTALGLRTVLLARQRQTASELASARLEHLRSVPYSQVALSTAPVHSTDNENPDYEVSADGSTYTLGTGAHEVLVVDEADGGVLHFEDPVQVGSTLMRIYQYVTWVDDPAISGTQDYKRVTVVVEYKAPSVNGVSKTVSQSSLFTTGTVTVGAATTTTAASTTTIAATTTTSTPSSTTTSSACPGDTSAPTGSFTLNGSSGAQAGYTAAASLTITVSLTDSCAPIQMRFSNDGATWGSWVTYDSLNPTASWALASGDGTKSVTMQATDAVNNTVTLSAATIVLDSTKPTTPSSFTAHATCSGTNRTVSLSWGVSTDTNFSGYRVYRSTDGVSWSSLLTTTSLSATDTTKKALDSVRYYVVGYDKAGNESAPTAIASYVKNKCSP
jgi:hypothetical protein